MRACVRACGLADSQTRRYVGRSVRTNAVRQECRYARTQVRNNTGTQERRYARTQVRKNARIGTYVCSSYRNIDSFYPLQTWVR